jgi:hypothetical protein
VPSSVAPPATVAVPTSTAPNSATAEALLAKSLADLRADQWVDITETTVLPGETDVVNQVAGPATGRQIFTQNGQVQAEVELIDGVVYANAYTESGAEQYLGFSANAGVPYLHRWISFAPTDPGYSGLAAGISIQDWASADDVTPPFGLGPTTSIGGEAVQTVTGTGSGVPGAAVSVDAFVTMGSVPQLLEVTAKATVSTSSGQSEPVTSQTSLTGFGIAAALPVPAGPVPASTIASLLSQG